MACNAAVLLTHVLVVWCFYCDSAHTVVLLCTGSMETMWSVNRYFNATKCCAYKQSGFPAAFIVKADTRTINTKTLNIHAFTCITGYHW